MNKTAALTSLFFTLILLTSISQAEEAKKTPSNKADLLKTVDKNKDGKASKQEFIAAMERKFKSMDVDKNEAVSVQELKVYGVKDAEARRKALQAAKLVGRSEKIISKKKFIKLFTHRAEREFASLDKNHDNELSANEVGANKSKKKTKVKAKPQIKKNMPKADFVALFSDAAERNFSKLDKNRDGKLTNSELGIKPKNKQIFLAKAKPVSQPKPKSVLPTLPKIFSFLHSSPKPKPIDKKVQRQKLIKSFFTDIDANNDGNISNKEKKFVFERLFSRLDSNHDQLITQDEIIAGRHIPLSEKH